MSSDRNLFIFFSPGSDHSNTNFLSSYSWITWARWNKSGVLQVWLPLLVLWVYYHHLCYRGQLITWMFKTRMKNETTWYHCGYLLESISLKQEQVSQEHLSISNLLQESPVLSTLVLTIVNIILPFANWLNSFHGVAVIMKIIPSVKNISRMKIWAREKNTWKILACREKKQGSYLAHFHEMKWKISVKDLREKKKVLLLWFSNFLI